MDKNDSKPDEKLEDQKLEAEIEDDDDDLDLDIKADIKIGATPWPTVVVDG